jgi:hypothetical protein
MFFLAKGVTLGSCRVTTAYLKRLLPRYLYRHPSFIHMVNALRWRSTVLFNQANSGVKTSTYWPGMIVRRCVMWLKACPKCEGDLYLRREIDGKDIVCIQCGYTRHILPEDEGLRVYRRSQPARGRVAA